MGFASTGLTVNRWLERLLVVGMLSAMGLGYLFHGALAHWSGAVVYLFACMSFVTALGTRFGEFRYVVKHPLVLFMIFLLLHVVMPLVALGAASAIIPSRAYDVGIVLAASIPVGVTSVMWTGMANGELSLALAVVAMDTMLSPLVIPTSIHVMIGKAVSLPFWTLFWGLVWMVVIPTICGIACNEVSRGRIKSAVQPVAGPVSKLSMLAVVAINVAVVTPTFRHHSGFGPVLITLASLAAFGYVLGYAASRFSKSEQARSVTMTYTVGMRNISAGIAIATHYFGHTVSIPVVLAMLFQQPCATVAFVLLNRRRSRLTT